MIVILLSAPPLPVALWQSFEGGFGTHTPTAQRVDKD
jgi:hypothetical protein